MERRTLVALALSFLVLGFYPLVLQKMYPQHYAQKEKTKSETVVQVAPVSPALKTAWAPGEDISYQNQTLKLLFNKKAGSIRQIEFLKFPGADKKPILQFLSMNDMGDSPTSVQILNNADSPASYEISTLGDEITAQANLLTDIKLTKKYSFSPSGYAVDLSLIFENSSPSPQEVQYQIFCGSRIPVRNAIDNQYLEGNFYSDISGKEALKHVGSVKLGKQVHSQGILKWVANKDRHFSIILKPKSSGEFSGLIEGLPDHDFRVSLVSPKITVAPQSSVRQDFLLYMGPNDIRELLPLGLESLVNFGKLDMIGKLLIGALEILQKPFHNYGLAIIFLTILINLLLFPLTRQSYMSLKRMQLIQPQMNKLKDQHKKSPEKLNREMMELYKKHKVNPFGGCLPMLMQMPVFIALYVALSKYVNLVGSKFLWIHDLSSPDDVPLPFTLPFIGNTVHVLPLVMMVAMVIQQKLTQIKAEGQDPATESQQKMMAVMMPIIFGFIFYAMPSALVLYWLTNTLLMSAYQWHLKRVTLT